MLLSTMRPVAAGTDETPDGFVQCLYARYRADIPGIPRSDPEGAALYAPVLLDAFVKDPASANNDGVTIDCMPPSSPASLPTFRLDRLV